MATTTPNFGWSVPTSTDLVKDGATAIETLGDSIDASLVDLKGGTTGQVLAKNSNTDMDFVWSNDAAGMTNPMTTTGDTIYSSSGSTPARLGIGTAGQVLQVNSGATAPEWATPAAGGMTLLSTTNLTTATTNITSISQSYTNLMIEIEGIIIPTAQRLNVQLRNSTNAQTVYAAGITGGGAANYNGLNTIDIYAANLTASDGRNVSMVKIDNYASSTRKGLQIYGTINNGGTYVNYAGGIDATPAINAFQVALTATPTAGTVKIWGIK
jgi:hypothetical protein